MEKNELKSLSTDELWELYEKVTSELARKIVLEKSTLEERLRKIASASNVLRSGRERRPYPKVHPKYRNPNSPGEIWSGRGKQPRWLVAQLRSGKKLEQFLISRSSSSQQRRRAG